MRTRTTKRVRIRFGRGLMERLALVLLVGGCTKQWQSVELRPKALDARDIAQIWSHGTLES